MTSPVGRIYVAALSLLVFFVLWSTVAARPWATTTATDPRLAGLAKRQTRIERQAAAAEQLVAVRWAAYRAALKERRARARAAPAPAPAPRVRVITLPALTSTRTS